MHKLMLELGVLAQKESPGFMRGLEQEGNIVCGLFLLKDIEPLRVSESTSSAGIPGLWVVRGSTEAFCVI